MKTNALNYTAWPHTLGPVLLLSLEWLFQANIIRCQDTVCSHLEKATRVHGSLALFKHFSKSLPNMKTLFIPRGQLGFGSHQPLYNTLILTVHRCRELNTR